MLGVGGTEADRVSFEMLGVLLDDLASISPLAVDILFVNDDIAQPAHDVSFCGVPILGVAPLTGPTFEGGGRIVSGRLVAYLRTRLT